MSVATPDTHDVVKVLLSAGFTDQQAEAVACRLPNAQIQGHSMLATKAQVEASRAESRITKVAFWKFMCAVAYGVQTLVIFGALIKLVKP